VAQHNEGQFERCSSAAGAAAEHDYSSKLAELQQIFSTRSLFERVTDRVNPQTGHNFTLRDMAVMPYVRNAAGNGFNAADVRELLWLRITMAYLVEYVMSVQCGLDGSISTDARVAAASELRGLSGSDLCDKLEALACDYLLPRFRPIFVEYAMQGVHEIVGVVPTAADLRSLEQCVRWHLAMVCSMISNAHFAGSYHELRKQCGNQRRTLYEWYAMVRSAAASTTVSGGAATATAATATATTTAAAEPMHSSEAEMLSYEVLLSSQPGSLLRELKQRPAVRNSAWVQRAVKVRLAVQRKDYRGFFELFTDSPYLFRSCMLSVFTHMRTTALCCLAENMDDIKLSVITEQLCFVDEAEALECCLSHNLALCGENVVFKMEPCMNLLHTPAAGMPARAVSAAESATARALAVASAKGMTLQFSKVSLYATYSTGTVLTYHTLTCTAQSLSHAAITVKHAVRKADITSIRSAQLLHTLLLLSTTAWLSLAVSTALSTLDSNSSTCAYCLHYCP
jgi:SAC3/GANP family